MKRYTQTVAALALVGLMAGGATALAAGSGMTADTPSKTRSAKTATKGQELVLTGTVAKDQISVAGKKRECFVLVTDTGARLHLPAAKTGKKGSASPVIGAKLHLPLAKAGKHAGTTPAIKLADYLGQNVKVVAMGSERKKGDKTVVRIQTLKRVDKLAAAA